MCDIRKSTCIIVERNGYYLVAADVFGNIRWSRSPYDAYRIRQKMIAYKLAWRVGGSALLFNPIVGKTKSLNREVNSNERTV